MSTALGLELAGLLARVEAATGADRSLNAALLRSFGWTVSGDGAITHDGSRAIRIPDLTASLDDALALCERVLPECEYRVAGGPETGENEAWATASVTTMNWPAKREYSFEDSPTPALALLAAMLRALIAQGEAGTAEAGENLRR